MCRKAKLPFRLSSVVQPLHKNPVGEAPVRCAVRLERQEVAPGLDPALVDRAHGDRVAGPRLADVDGKHGQPDQPARREVVPIDTPQHLEAVLKDRGLVDLFALVAGEPGSHLGAPVCAPCTVGRNAACQVVGVHPQDVPFQLFKCHVRQRASECGQ